MCVLRRDLYHDRLERLINKFKKTLLYLHDL